MKEEKTKSKRRLIYYLALGLGVLLLVAATVLTVYFLTQPANVLEEQPPAEQQPGGNEPEGPSGPQQPDEPGEPDEPDKPSTGDDTVRFVSPVENVSYTITYGQIYRNRTLGWIYRHKAVDFSAAEGTEVRSMADGVVEKISLSQETGNIVVINHGDGLRTCYRFVEPNASLKEGASVKKGETIGTVAAAYGIERSEGTHLHLEITLGELSVDPADYLEPVLQEK